MAGRGQGCLPRVQGRGRLRHLSVGLRVRRHVRALRPRADGEVPVEQFYYGGAGCMYVACPRNRVSPDPSWDQVRWSECAIGAGRMPASCQGGISACPFFSPQPPPRTLCSLTRSTCSVASLEEEMQEAGAPLPHPLLATLCRLTARLPRHRRRHARRGGGAA